MLATSEQGEPYLSARQRMLAATLPVANEIVRKAFVLGGRASTGELRGGTAQLMPFFSECIRDICGTEERKLVDRSFGEAFLSREAVCLLGY